MENWPVRYRLAVALVVPLLALAGLSALLVGEQVNAADAATRSQTAAQLTIRVNTLLRDLAEERYESSSYIGSGYLVKQAETLASRGPVDRAYAAVQDAARSLAKGTRLTTAVAAAETQTDTLPALRRAMDAHTLRPGPANSGANPGTIAYDGIVRSWLAVTAAQNGVGTSDTQVARTVDALTAISNVAEQAAQQRGDVSLVLFLRRLDPANFGAIREASGAETAWLGQFDTSAAPAQLQLYQEVVGPVVDPVNQLQDRAVTEAQTNQKIDVSGDQWLSAVDAQITALNNVQSQITTDLDNRSSTLAGDAETRAWLAGILAALVMALTIAVSVIIARRLARQLHALREDALDIAEHRLPAVTTAIRERRPVDATLGSAAGDQHDSHDEIGDVGRSLREVYAAAVASATEVAAQHSLSASMRNLARRSQTLIHRQLKLITDLERDQQDPDMLDRLFRLDHLATRMRREVEGQIALSGGRPSRVFRSPVKLVDALRAAVAEVEAYTRVEVVVTADDRLVGPVVGDVIHLLAELVENATQMSPENTVVTVTGSTVGTGIAVEIADRGIGIQPSVMAEFNDRLADPPPFNPEKQGDKLGLWVVANLAARHGIDVRLTRSAYGGVTAVVLLPAELLADDGHPAPAPAEEDPLRAALDRISALERLDAVAAGYDGTIFAVGGDGASYEDPTPSLRRPRPMPSPPARPGPAEPAPASYTDPQVLSVRESYFMRPEWREEPAHPAATNGAPLGTAPNDAGPHGAAPTAAPARPASNGAPGGGARVAGQTVFDAVRAEWGEPGQPGSIAVGPPSAAATPPSPAQVGGLPPVPPRTPPAGATGPARALRSRAGGEAAPVAAPVPPPPNMDPEPLEPPLGHLPSRRRGEYLSAELRGQRLGATSPPSAPDPERARRLITSFRAGFHQGRPRDHEGIDDGSEQ
jgi:hypothetical protein